MIYSILLLKQKTNGIILYYELKVERQTFPQDCYFIVESVRFVEYNYIIMSKRICEENHEFFNVSRMCY